MDSVEIIRLSFDKMNSTVTSVDVEMFREILDKDEARDNLGLFLRCIDKEQIKRGMVVYRLGSVTPYTEFKCETYILSKDEGGRPISFFNKYCPQYYFRNTP